MSNVGKKVIKQTKIIIIIEGEYQFLFQYINDFVYNYRKRIKDKILLSINTVTDLKIWIYGRRDI